MWLRVILNPEPESFFGLGLGFRARVWGLVEGFCIGFRAGLRDAFLKGLQGLKSLSVNIVTTLSA